MPDECIFAQTTTCVSANLETGIQPYLIGGWPVCAKCGCIAASMEAIGNIRLPFMKPT